MKKILFFLAVAFLAPVLAFGQVTVTNTTSRVVTLKSTDKSSEMTLNPHKSKPCSFAPGSGQASFLVYVYEGASEKALGQITKSVSRSQFNITDADLTGRGSSGDLAANVLKNYGAITGNNLPNPDPNNQLSNDVQPFKVKIVNSSKYTFFIIDGPCKGNALKPGQEIKDSVTVYPGLLQFTVKQDVQEDATASGRQYRESVISMIVTEKARIEIKNENLAAMGGNAIKVFAKSLFPYKFVFVSGPWKGQALGTGDFTDKADLNEGFNSFAIQFFQDGHKYQADMEIIITKREKVLVLKSITNMKMIK